MKKKKKWKAIKSKFFSILMLMLLLLLLQSNDMIPAYSILSLYMCVYIYMTIMTWKKMWKKVVFLITAFIINMDGWWWWWWLWWYGLMVWQWLSRYNIKRIKLYISSFFFNSFIYSNLSSLFLYVFVFAKKKKMTTKQFWSKYDDKNWLFFHRSFNYIFLFFLLQKKN